MSEAVQSLMSKKVIEIPAGRSALEAFHTMRRYRIHHLPVRKGDRVLGVVSESDLRHAIQVRSRDRGFSAVTEVEIDPHLKVEECLTQPVVQVGPKTDLATAVSRMMEEHVSALVVSEGGQTLGLLTTYDLYKMLINILKQKEKGPSEEVGNLLYSSPLNEVLDALSSSGI